MADNTLDPFIPMINFFAEFLGPDIEVILYDTQEMRIRHVVNPFSADHQAGAPIGELEANFLKNRVYEQRDVYHNYRSFSHDRKKLRSSTYFLKQDAALKGMITINYQVSDLIAFRELIDGMINGYGAEKMAKDEFYMVESQSLSFEEMMSSVVHEVVDAYPVEPERLSYDERMDIIRTLDEKGTFLIKGSVAEVAEVLHCSEVTVYRYIRELLEGGQ